MSLALAVLKKGEGRTLKAGGAWIFDNEIDSVTGAFENGDVVMSMTLTAIPWDGALSICTPKYASGC